jgi:hypothetical protein
VEELHRRVSSKGSNPLHPFPSTSANLPAIKVASIKRKSISEKNLISSKDTKKYSEIEDSPTNKRNRQALFKLSFVQMKITTTRFPMMNAVFLTDRLSALLQRLSWQSDLEFLDPKMFPGWNSYLY